MEPISKHKSLAAMFLSQAGRYGNKILYRFAQGARWHSLTWTETLTHVREIALGLVSVGIKPGDRVAIFANNRLEWLLVDWANICIGALTVPVYAASAPSQARHVIEHADPVVLFVDSSNRFDGLQLQARAVDQLKAVVAFEGERSGSGVGVDMPVVGLDRLREMGRAHADPHGGIFEQLVQRLSLEDDLTVIYTSGATGTPKGVLTTHANYLYMINAVNAAVPSSDADVTLHLLPTAHSLGRLEHFMAVANGWTLAIARSIETIPSDLRSIRPTVIFSVPRIYENAYHRVRLRMERAPFWRRRIFYWALSARRQRIEDRDAKRLGWGTAAALWCVDRGILARVRALFGGRLRLAISGGAPLARDIAEFFHALGILILEGYGLTETSTVSHVNRADKYKFGTVGLPLEGTECHIAPDSEILLRGPNIFKRYYRDVIATDEAIDADGWFHTGDVGEIDEAGFLRITDRKKDLLVTSGGKKVAPQKIENLLKTDSLITQVMAVGSGQRHLLALIALDQKRIKELASREGITLSSPEEISSHPWVRALMTDRIREMNKQLSPYEAVRQFCILTRDFTVEDEELTPTLKLRRRVIMDRYKELIDETYREL
jgi:long-chain acyl-CoA synthetase